MIYKIFHSIVFSLLVFIISCKPDWESTSTKTVTDIDGNVYEIVTIGNQVWMAENLKVTKYRNGDAIPNVTNDTEWSNLSTGAYCSYDNDDSNITTYGFLYNWFTVNDNRNLAPAGWHIPTDEEWKQLEIYLGMSQTVVDNPGYRPSRVGNMLKSTNGWNYNEGTNSSRFTALPSGAHNYNEGFVGIGDIAYFWSSTEATDNYAWSRHLSIYHDTVGYIRVNRISGLSVRCIKD
ncbi:fibrobacter succinogenes major paralogous domain-containing protein [Candidatus Neomarinimicrobiota bacterium]